MKSIIDDPLTRSVLLGVLVAVLSMAFGLWFGIELSAEDPTLSATPGHIMGASLLIVSTMVVSIFALILLVISLVPTLAVIAVVSLIKFFKERRINKHGNGKGR